VSLLKVVELIKEEQKVQGVLGVDVGSVSTNVVVLDESLEVIESIYLRTNGRPIETVLKGIGIIKDRYPQLTIKGVGTTGSGRQIAGIILGGDIIKNEITAHAVAALHIIPEVKTILEIGGQDSKIIIIRNGIVTDFAMNTVCAAGTGSFLDQQAARLGIPIQEFGQLALTADIGVRIAGRCAVFAESDMIHKQQMGYSVPSIIKGLCEALVRNYLNNVGKGKEILGPIIFQGGVAANAGIHQAFCEALGCEIIVPKYYNVMGAVGAALLAYEKVKKINKTNFRGFKLLENNYLTRSFECKGCANVCEILEFRIDDKPVARWGGRCDKWDVS
jgi:predicted CoA-substrate-specific enzyme activase